MLHYQYNYISLCNNIACFSVPHGASSHNSSSSFLAAPWLNEWCCFISPLPGSLGGAAEFLFALYPPWFVLLQMPNWAVLYQIRPSVSSLFSSAWCLTVSSTAEAESKDKPGWLQDQLQKGKEKLAEVGQDALKLLTEVSSKEGLHWSYRLCLKSDTLL